jgi:hypothetical protein
MVSKVGFGLEMVVATVWFLQGEAVQAQVMPLCVWLGSPLGGVRERWIEQAVGPDCHVVGFTVD